LNSGEHDISGTGLAHLAVYRRFIESLQEVDERLVDYFIALICLHVTELMKQGQSNSGIVAVMDELIHFDVTSSQKKIQLSILRPSFVRAADIMLKLNTEVNTDTMIQVELVKAFLHMSIDNTDVDQERENCWARVFLARLYYSTEQYQSAFDQILSMKTSSQTRCSSHATNSQLPRNIGGIHIVSGLIILYDSLARTTPPCQQVPISCKLTTNLCAMYYVVKCDFLIENTSELLMKQYVEIIKETKNLFIGDILLICFVTRRKVLLYSRRLVTDQTVPRSLSYMSKTIVFDTLRLRCLLMKSAVERLTKLHHVMSRDYSSSISMVTIATARQCMHTNMNVVYFCANRM
jgi:hypothetical protein